MKDYFEQSIRALQLAGMSERTQEAYTRAVRKLVDFYQKTPDLISEAELQDYFLHRRNVDKWSSATLRIAYSGIKFFFINVLKRDWHIFTYLRSKKDKRFPAFWTRKKSFVSWVVFKHFTITPAFQPFMHAACGFQKLWPSRSQISMARG